ncbi:MAG: Protein of unknown function (DUF3153) [Rhodobacteraceae bacterium HLUCCA12]|nr:MAG: Protein of unknown function (DUF3153) [Rhodobacteraceae bacterium HLUCCA12]
MRFSPFAAVGLAVVLAGCIDMDMDTAILGPDEARVSGHIEVTQEMYNMMGGEEEFCPTEDGGTLEMTETHARCNMLMEGTFAEVFEPSEDGSPSPTATDLGDGTVRVVFPMGDMTSEMDEMTADPQMEEMFRPMLEGRSIALSVSGAEIVSSNGTVSDDDTRASIDFKLTDLFEDETDIPENFETVVRY